jgi:hypothetical protein
VLASPGAGTAFHRWVYGTAGGRTLIGQFALHVTARHQSGKQKPVSTLTFRFCRAWPLRSCPLLPVVGVGPDFDPRRCRQREVVNSESRATDDEVKNLQNSRWGLITGSALNGFGRRRHYSTALGLTREQIGSPARVFHLWVGVALDHLHCLEPCPGEFGCDTAAAGVGASG